MSRATACLRLATLALGVSLLLPRAGMADAVEDFYRGKNLTIVIGFGAGETYDLYARLLARHMARYIPGRPTLVPQNMPGAGSLNAANHIYNVAPRDGTVFGVTHRFVPIMPLLNMEGPQFQAEKYSYLGSANRETTICMARADSGIATIDDLRNKEFVVGTTGKGAELTNFTATLRNVLGFKLKVITGYLTSIEVNHAVEKKEIQGRCGESYGSLMQLHPDWVEKGEVRLLLQLAMQPDPKLPPIPALGPLIGNDTDRSAVELLLSPAIMGRPFFGPPGIPAERLAALRKAFDQAMSDPDLVREGQGQRLDIAPMTGQEIDELIARLYRSPAPVVARARSLVAE
jgi:tripartite-type tricarboxylate transporter receptor subunit TctC